MSDERFLSSLAEFIVTASEYINGKLGDSVSDKDWIMEQIKTIRNLSNTAILLRELGRSQELETILEQMFLEIQQVNDDACVVRDDKG